jgi:hypothetical protein
MVIAGNRFVNSVKMRRKKPLLVGFQNRLAVGFQPAADGLNLNPAASRTPSPERR